MALCAGVPCCAHGQAEGAANASHWRVYGRKAFVAYLVSLGCEDCAPLLLEGTATELPFTLSSQVFGCADVDVLLPSLHWVYESVRRRHGGELPGLLVDGGANVGRATARWIAALGDVFGRRAAQNESQAPCIICAGADATAGGGAAGAAAAPPTVAVVAVEPSASNFALLRKHAAEGLWEYEGYLGIQAALGSEAGEAMLAFNDDFAVDEVATLLFKATDERPRQRVRVMTLDEVVAAARASIAGVGGADVFLLKLDIEGMEPQVLRSVARAQAKVQFITFEYASNVWQQSLAGVIADLFADGYFCFLITPERLFPVSGAFWDMAYELPMWSNVFCGLEDDPDLAALVQLHVGAIGLWPMLPGTYLEGFAGDSEAPVDLAAARALCTDLGQACAGVTCECPSDHCGRQGDAVDRCTARVGTGGVRWSPTGEVTYLRDAELGELFLIRRRQRAAQARAAAAPAAW